MALTTFFTFRLVAIVPCTFLARYILNRWTSLKTTRKLFHFPRTYIQTKADIIPTFDQWEVFSGSAQTDVEVMVVVSTTCCEQSTPIDSRQTENARNNHISLQI